MLRISFCEQSNELHAKRELARLELVALACEIAAVAQHARDALAAGDQSRRAESVRQQCGELLQAAGRVLAHDPSLEQLTILELEGEVRSLRALQRSLAALRGDDDRAHGRVQGWLRRLRPGSVPARWRLAAAASPIQRV